MIVTYTLWFAAALIFLVALCAALLGLFEHDTRKRRGVRDARVVEVEDDAITLAEFVEANACDCDVCARVVRP